MLVQRLFAVLSMSTIALSTILPNAIAQISRRTNNVRPTDGTLTMVMVDQAQLSNTQRTAFQRYLRTANLPRTKVGQRCQFYGKPDVWCLLLDQDVAQQVYTQLRKQRDFGTAATIKEVRRLTVPEKN